MMSRWVKLFRDTSAGAGVFVQEPQQEPGCEELVGVVLRLQITAAVETRHT